MKTAYEQYMDELTCRVGNAVHGESDHDAIHACAVVCVYGIIQSTPSTAARQRRLEALFAFMRDVMLHGETEGTKQ